MEFKEIKAVDMNKYKFKTALLSIVFIVGAGTNMVEQPKAKMELTEQEEDRFYNDLQTGIKKSLDQYTKLKSSIKTSNATEEERKTLINAATVLEVKYTLYKNFYNAPSIKSPAVRKELESLFQKNFITLEDLTHLKKTVATERERLGLPTKPAEPEKAPI